MRRGAVIMFEDYCVRTKEFVPGKSIAQVHINFSGGGRKNLIFIIHPCHTDDLSETMMRIWHYAIFLSDLKGIDVPMSQWTWRVQPWRKLTSWEKK